MTVRRKTAEDFRARVNNGLPAQLLRNQPGAVRGSIWTLAAEALEQLAKAPDPSSDAMRDACIEWAAMPASARERVCAFIGWDHPAAKVLQAAAPAPRPLRVYVAGGSAEAVMVRGYMVRLKRSGVEITYDWTEDVIRWRGAGCQDRTAEERAAHARADLDGIERADIVWWILPAARSEGSAFEAGYALGIAESVQFLASAPPRLVVSGDRAAHGRVFPELAAERWESHAAALAAIVSLAAAHRNGDQIPTS